MEDRHRLARTARGKARWVRHPHRPWAYDTGNARPCATLDRMLPILATLDHLLHLNTDLISALLDRDDVAWRAPDARGRNALWILGHCAAYRHRLLRLLGEEPLTTLWEGQVQKGGHANDLSPGLRATTFATALGEAGDLLTTRLAQLDRTDLERPFSGTLRDGSATLGGALRYLTYHETLHVGQISFLLAR